MCVGICQQTTFTGGDAIMFRVTRMCAMVMLLLCTAERALAQGDAERDTRQTSIGLLVGYGVELSDNLMDPFGLTLGVRGGHTFDAGIYVGGQFNYFFGESVDFGTVEATVRALTLAVEGGYDIVAAPLVLRPSVAVGAAFFSGSGSSGGVEGSDSFTRFYVGPGVSLLYPLDDWFVGVDARVLVVPDDETRTAFTAQATGGMRF
jgi:hypothetical protein